MSHLTRDERLLALDGALEPARLAHVAACPACRTDVEALGHVVARVRAVDVPEPSPLFWDHLAARVGDAIAREPAPARERGWWSSRLAWAAAALVVAAAGGGFVARSRTPPPAPAVAHVAATNPSTAPASEVAATSVPSLDADAPLEDSWALIAAMVDDANAEALAPQAGQSELSISALSDDERTALARELAAELTPARLREG
jgi:hypothetical protein